MSADDEEVTDNIPIPSAKASGEGPPVTVEHAGTSASGQLQGVSGDTITVVTSAALEMDAQVQVSADGIASTGVVIWTRAGADGNAAGIEIIGGAEEWAKLG